MERVPFLTIFQNLSELFALFHIGKRIIIMRGNAAHCEGESGTLNLIPGANTGNACYGRVSGHNWPESGTANPRN